jgi:nucleoporin POM152
MRCAVSLTQLRYTRSIPSSSRDKPPIIQETKHEYSDEHSKVIGASEEGTYEVVAIKDRYCSFSKLRGAGNAGDGGKARQKLLEL